MSSAASLAELLDPRVAAGILAARLGPQAGAATADRLVRCARRIREAGVPAGEPVHAAFVPGRIEVLGKHTDYAGGRSLLAAVDRGICIVAAGGADDVVSVTDARTGERQVLPIDPDLASPPGWTAYPAAVVRRVARNFPGRLQGARLAFESTLPPAAGMSSSSALVIAIFQALSALGDLPETDAYRANVRSVEELADFLAAVESGADYRALSGGLGVGTRGGSQDHTAILCARPGALVQYAFRPARFERSLPFPVGCIFVIAASGVTAEKTGAARERYNAAAEQMQRIGRLWREATDRSEATVGEALASSPRVADRLRDILRAAEPSLLPRFEQFVEESETNVPAAGDALAAGDLDRFGRVVDRSQELAERSLRNQVPETVALARLARELGAQAASAFGAGFGGSVWALVRESAAAEFVERWRAGYLARFPQHAGSANFFVTRPGPPAQRLI